MTGDDGQKVDRAVAAVSHLNGRVGRNSVAEVLKAFLNITDYRAALIQVAQARGARNVSKLLTDAHTSGLVRVGEFLDYVKGLRDSGTREGEARATTEGAVQIMSVHAAKGLEFRLVAIGDITRQRPGRDSILVQPSLGVLLPLKEDDTLPAVYQLGKVRNRDQEAAESDRLLYVAATRAQDKLLLSGCIGLTSAGAPSRLGDWLGRMSGSNVLGLTDERIEHDPEGEHTIRIDLQMGETPVACTITEPNYVPVHPPREISLAHESPVPLPPPLLAPVSPGEEVVDERTLERERTPPQRVWRVVPQIKRARAPARVIGSLVHEALAAWRFPDGAFATWVRARARGYGITDPHQLTDAGRQTRELLSRFQGHSFFRKMDGAERRLHEISYSMVWDGQVESGTIDAMFLRDGKWTIVEFKTDNVRDETNLPKLLEDEDYLNQAKRYANAAEQLLGQLPQVFLCMLNVSGQIYLHQTN